MFNTMNDLLDYCKMHRDELLKVDGNCLKCILYRKCRKVLKEHNIIGFMKMDRENSRFPGWFFDLFHSHPRLIHAVPESLFALIYGNKDKNCRLYDRSWGCIFFARDILENLDQIEKVYDMLTDEQSRQVYLNVLMYRLTAEKAYIIQAYTEVPQYFPNAFCGATNDAVYVDGGAYIGDTFLECCKHNEPPRKAYLFEPDPRNMEKLLQNTKSFQEVTDIIAIQKGLYRTVAELYFTSKGSASSSISEQPQHGAEKVGVTSIDSIVTDETDFIKMDIEAFEPFALDGARQTILKSYPKLAICIYHKTSHLWVIPLMIKEMFPDYTRFEIRHHGKTYYETVFYAYQ